MFATFIKLLEILCLIEAGFISGVLLHTAVSMNKEVRTFINKE